MLRDTIVKDSALKQENGVLFYYDISRGKWVSVFREVFSFTHDHRNIPNDMWLRIEGKIPSNINGYLMPRDSVITGLSAKTENLSDCVFRIRKNGVLTDITSLTFSGQTTGSINSLNINLDAGDYIQCFLEVTSGNVDYPIVNIEVAARTT
jgi:hypothetical protein